MSDNFQKMLARFLAALMFFSVMMSMWDIWWHETIGRESFWIPPHIPFYAAIILAIALAVFGWHKTRIKVWRNLAVVFLFIPIAGFFDNLWHNYFGVENPQAAFPYVFWSPAHIIIVMTLMASAYFILPVIRLDESVHARRLFGSLIFGAILTEITFFVTPLQPMGLYENFASHYLGYAGAGIIAFLTIGILLFSERWIPELGAATMVAAFYLILMGIVGTGQMPGSGLILLPQNHHPSWIIIFSYLAAAVAVDVTKSFPLWLRGFLSALFWSLTFYIFGMLILNTALGITFGNVVTAVIASVVGGVLAGYLLQKFHKINQ